MRKYLLAFIFCFVFSNIIYADDKAIFVGLFTEHIRHGDGLNEQNKIIGIKAYDFVLSTFENSHYDRSWFLGYGFKTKKAHWNDFWIRGNCYLGLLTGYDDFIDLFGISPAGTITGEIGFKSISIETMFMPIDGGILTLLLNYNF